MRNEDVRAAAKAGGVRLWQLAEELGLSESTLSRKLRHEWTDEEKRRAYQVIEAIQQRQGRGAGESTCSMYASM